MKKTNGRSRTNPHNSGTKQKLTREATRKETNNIVNNHHIHMPCFFKPEMHHTCLRIVPCLCGVCLLCCVLLSDVASSGWFRERRVCEDPFDYVRLPSSWTRSSSLRDFRQDDHTLEITTIFAMLVCSLFCYANATMPTICLSASQIAMSNL